MTATNHSTLPKFYSNLQHDHVSYTLLNQHLQHQQHQRHLPPDTSEEPPPTKSLRHGSFGLIAADKGHPICHTTHLNQHGSDRAACHV